MSDYVAAAAGSLIGKAFNLRKDEDLFSSPRVERTLTEEHQKRLDQITKLLDELEPEIKLAKKLYRRLKAKRAELEREELDIRFEPSAPLFAGKTVNMPRFSRIVAGPLVMPKLDVNKTHNQTCWICRNGGDCFDV